jgi:hypothetical protein
MATSKKAAQAQQYRDDPDAVSMHTTRSDYEYDDTPDLPSYSDSEAVTASSTRPFAGIPDEAPPQDEYAAIQPSENRWRNKGHGKAGGSEITIRMEKRLEDPIELFNYVWDYLRVVPPNPKVRIYGYHSETTYKNNKKETNHITDFDFAFSLARYLPRCNGNNEDGGWRCRIAMNGDKVYRGSFRKTRAPGYTQDIEVGGNVETKMLKDWCEEYCASKAMLKVFRITREVEGLDTEYLRSAIEGAVRSTNYRGHLSVHFPIEDRYVDIYNDHCKS